MEYGCLFSWCCDVFELSRFPFPPLFVQQLLFYESGEHSTSQSTPLVVLTEMWSVGDVNGALVVERKVEVGSGGIFVHS